MPPPASDSSLQGSPVAATTASGSCWPSPSAAPGSPKTPSALTLPLPPSPPQRRNFYSSPSGSDWDQCRTQPKTDRLHPDRLRFLGNLDAEAHQHRLLRDGRLQKRLKPCAHGCCSKLVITKPCADNASASDSSRSTAASAARSTSKGQMSQAQPSQPAKAQAGLSKLGPTAAEV